MVSMLLRIDLGSSRRGGEIMEFYRSDIEERKGFELVDCSETVDLFLWNWI